MLLVWMTGCAAGIKHVEQVSSNGGTVSSDGDGNTDSGTGVESGGSQGGASDSSSSAGPSFLSSLPGVSIQVSSAKYSGMISSRPAAFQKESTGNTYRLSDPLLAHESSKQ